ncbi:MAG: trypsin-like peptidase domain-containing protein, partial [Pseudomonadota bacterium]
FVVLASTALFLQGLSPLHARGTPESFSDLVESVMPAVVNISTAQNITETGFGIPPGREAASLGSGFIVDNKGIVVTNNHVIQNADRILITLENGEEYEATLRGVDTETDLAVLQIQADQRFPSVSFGDSDKARVGDWVVAIGQPFGLGGSVSAGIISARNRVISDGLYDDYIQTDAAINRGNSGGPLFDMKGRVVGVNTVIYSQTGGSVGVGFAVPGNLASTIVRQLIDEGETTRGYLGVRLEDISDDAQKRLNLSSKKGALVALPPSPNGPAGLAGIQKDDVILRFNGKLITDTRKLSRAVADTPVGPTVPVVLLRNGRQVTIQVTVARRETAAAFQPGTIELAGLTLEAATADIKQLYGLEDSTQGVVVTYVDARSPLSQSLREGDVIMEVGWDEVKSPESIRGHLERLREAGSGPVQILVRRGERMFYAHITP